MRITDREKKIIRDAARSIFGPDVSIFLFGSRVGDTVKGGDIDLYIETTRPSPLQNKISFLSRLKWELDDQRIDVVVNAPDKKDRAIYHIARQTGVRI
jgi:predicted nucleotidyltransferase